MMTTTEFRTPKLPTGGFDADVHCDSCGMRARLRLPRSTHAVDLGSYYVIPANGSCDCPVCKTKHGGGMATWRRVG